MSANLDERPSATRVARRALVHATLAYRATLEEHDSTVVEANLDEYRGWLESTGVALELEVPEREYLYATLHSVDPQFSIEAAWRVESLGVLAWALHRFELPAFDVPVDHRAVTHSVGFARVPHETVLATPKLRPIAELERTGSRLDVIQWRLEMFEHRAQPLDFAEAMRTEPLLGGTVADVPLLDGDMAVGGLPIARADPTLVAWCLDAVDERVRALDWLLGYCNAFSQDEDDL